MRAAANDVAVLDSSIAGFQCRGRYRESADPGAGHAAGAGVTGDVAPRPIVVLRIGPVFLRECPGLTADFNANSLAVVKCEHRELRVAIVASGTGVRPSTFALAIFILMIFEPFHV